MSNSMSVISAVGVMALAATVLVRTVRSDRAALLADRRDSAAGVTYTWTGGELVRTGPPRTPGEPLGGIEQWAAQEHIGVRRVRVSHRQSQPLVQMRVTR